MKTSEILPHCIGSHVFGMHAIKIAIIGVVVRYCWCSRNACLVPQRLDRRTTPNTLLRPLLGRRDRLS